MERSLRFVAAIIVAGTSCALSAQNLVLDDFESGAVGYTDEIHLITEEDGTFEVADNPSQVGNPSAKVLKYTRGTATANWAGCWAILKEKADLGAYRYLHVKYYRTNEASRLRVNFEGDGFGKTEFLPMDEYSPKGVNQWEELIYDLEANGLFGEGKMLNVLGFQPDFQEAEPVSGNNEAYIDDIVLSNEGSSALTRLPVDDTVKAVAAGSVITVSGVNAGDKVTVINTLGVTLGAAVAAGNTVAVTVPATGLVLVSVDGASIQTVVKTIVR